MHANFAEINLFWLCSRCGCITVNLLRRATLFLRRTNTNKPTKKKKKCAYVNTEQRIRIRAVFPLFPPKRVIYNNNMNKYVCSLYLAYLICLQVVPPAGMKTSKYNFGCAEKNPPVCAQGVKSQSTRAIKTVDL